MFNNYAMQAALGNIKLTHETNAEAKIVLLEADIQRAFNSKYIKSKLENKQIDINGETITVNARNVQFTLPGDNKIGLKAEVDLVESQETKQINLVAKPTLDEGGNRIAIADVEYQNEENAAFAQALLDSTKEVLDLRTFEMDAMSLQINRLEACPGKINMAASAVVREFPNS